MEMTILLWYQMLGWFLQLSRKWQYLCTSLVCWRTFCKARKKPIIWSLFLLLSMHLPQGIFPKWNFVVGLSMWRLWNVSDHTLFSPESSVLQGRDCVLGKVLRSLFSVDKEAGQATCTVGKGAWERWEDWK